MFWLIPAVCAAVALVLAAIGIVTALRANESFQGGLKRLKTPRPWMDPARPSAAFARLRAAIEGVSVVAGRCAAAMAQIRAGLAELRLPEAIAALRLAALAVRALAHLR